MKTIVAGPIGETQGKYAVTIEDGDLVVEARHPVAPVLNTVKTKFVDRLKKAIPGPFDDMLIDKIWDEVVKEVTE